MRKLSMGLLALVVIIVGWGVMQYNALVGMEEGVNSKWAQVDTVLQRRNDLIPNLVETVKGYATHEQEVFENVTAARARMAGAGSMEELSQADGELTRALGRLFAVAENYPMLKANENFRALQDELAGTENRIATARRDYNGAVEGYNAKIRRFPTNIIAGMFGFDYRAYFKVAEGAEVPPKVQF